MTVRVTFQRFVRDHRLQIDSGRYSPHLHKAMEEIFKESLYTCEFPAHKFVSGREVHEGSRHHFEYLVDFFEWLPPSILEADIDKYQYRENKMRGRFHVGDWDFLNGRYNEGFKVSIKKGPRDGAGYTVTVAHGPSIYIMLADKSWSGVESCVPAHNEHDAPFYSTSYQEALSHAQSFLLENYGPQAVDKVKRDSSSSENLQGVSVFSLDALRKADDELEGMSSEELGEHLEDLSHADDSDELESYLEKVKKVLFKKMDDEVGRIDVRDYITRHAIHYWEEVELLKMKLDRLRTYRKQVVDFVGDGPQKDEYLEVIDFAISTRERDEAIRSHLLGHKVTKKVEACDINPSPMHLTLDQIGHLDAIYTKILIARDKFGCFPGASLRAHIEKSPSTLPLGWEAIYDAFNEVAKATKSPEPTSIDKVIYDAAVKEHETGEKQEIVLKKTGDGFSAELKGSSLAENPKWVYRGGDTLTINLEEAKLQDVVIVSKSGIRFRVCDWWMDDSVDRAERGPFLEMYDRLSIVGNGSDPDFSADLFEWGSPSNYARHIRSLKDEKGSSSSGDPEGVLDCEVNIETLSVHDLRDMIVSVHNRNVCGFIELLRRFGSNVKVGLDTRGYAYLNGVYKKEGGRDD